MKRNNFKESNKNSLSTFKRERSLPVRVAGIFLFVISFAVFFASCTDTGSVGGAIAGPKTNIKFDTLKITNLSVDTLFAYTGNLDFFSAGRFQDPLFGDITATGLFKPRLASNRDTLLIDAQTDIFLNLVVFEEAVYGDTLSAQQFSLYEAKELWRANQWRIHDNIQMSSTPLVTFDVANKDTIKVPLPRSWVEEYAGFFNLSEGNRDSTYVREFFGLVMKPQNSNKIAAVNPFETTFIATNVDVIDPDSVTVDSTRLDSLVIGMREWAFSVKRADVTPSPPSSSKLISTFERVIRFDYNFSFDDLRREEIAKVELIFYVDKMLLEQSINQAGPAAVRPASKKLNLHYIEADELPQSLHPKPGPAYYEATYNEEDEAYHFNITQAVIRGFFEGTSDKRVFYLTIGDQEGIIRSGLIFNSLTTGKAPKVVVSYVETED